jgi:2-iminobutanoate/2-iminopropanoate deaminase
MTTVHRISSPYSYSTAVAAGDTVYLGLHRGFGAGFADQLRGTFAGISATLGQLGLELSHLVKVTVWLKEIQDLPEMEKIFHEYFQDGTFPVRMTATTEFFDEDCLVMIEGIAYRKTE